ncbi:GGDEF domain-containing protein [Prauserella sp. PE36]|uniref:EAL domain-containing protein n=1 Tax=Prauserella endophytica TaxID=1592324 RepID=A0ABY2RZ85_9PSEU|nr:diguanylate cyclase [Prauserella coralliicola]RBM13603.1 GGDEF domain-containing protein [Prauserella sp. PE36]TKG66616.1 EAL domain-containing protein [Prauserella endophytica]
MGQKRVKFSGVGVGVNQVRFAFQPLYSLHTGGVVAVEALARPASGGVGDLLGSALRRGRLVEVDVGLAARAVLDEAPHATLLPLHLNVTALTAAAPKPALQPLFDALGETSRRPREIVLEIGPPFHGIAPAALLSGMARLGELGFRLAFDGLGAGDLPLNLLAESRVDLVKLDRTTLRRLPDDPATVALVESLVHFAARTDLRLVATGIETEDQLNTVRRLGIRVVQGNLFAPARGGMAPMGAATLATPDGQEGPPSFTPTSAPTVKDFLRPATTLPAEATCEEVRNVLVDNDAPTGIIGLDEQGRPQWSIDRTRFLLAVTGPFGHALHANRPAERLADAPHVIRHGAAALELLDLVTDADWDRTADDVVVIDDAGRCQGVVLVHEVVRGLADAKIEEAAALNPLTRLPGSDSVARAVDRRIAAGQPLVVGWLDVDSFKKVNDTVGFAAGDDLIRALGRKLTDLATNLGGVTVSHVGGDDFLIACDIDKITTVADGLLDSRWYAEGLPVTVSLATLVCAGSSVGSYREISRLLAPLKKHAKDVTGSSWVNSWPGTDRIEVLRGINSQRMPRQRPAS